MLRLKRFSAGSRAPTSYNAMRPLLRISRDEAYGGTLSFTGTLQDDGHPVSGLVRVYDVFTGNLARQMLTDPITGVYTFTLLGPRPHGYDVILYSPTYITRAHVFRGVNPE